MQYVNDDMDEVFRKAAENYPLDTSSKDWNKVLNALQNTDEPKPSQKNGKGRFLWLLLLLPLGLICNQYFNRADTGSDKESVKENSETVSKNSEAPIENNNTGKGSSNSTKAIDNKIQDSKSTIHSGAPVVNALKNRVAYLANNRSISSSNLSNSSQGFAGDQFSGLENSEPGPLPVNYIPVKIRESQLFTGSNNALHKNIAEVLPSIKPSTKKNKRFYAGLVGGIDATTIKFQKIEEAGYDYGALFGFELNKKWSLEAGVFMDKKFYYSDGKYFDTYKIYMPPNSRIGAVSGNCKMIEVPLSIRYNFPSTKKSSWFSTAGLSSYFMKNEDYDYEYYYGTSTVPVQHSKEYKNSSTNLLSVVHVSGGYSHKIGNLGDLRIEPYLKIPVSGMGIGKMPLLSTGLHVGITKKLF